MTSSISFAEGLFQVHRMFLLHCKYVPELLSQMIKVQLLSLAYPRYITGNSVIFSIKVLLKHCDIIT